MIEVKTIVEGKEIKDEALEKMLKEVMKKVSLYDPMGLHSLESPFYVVALLLYMRRRGMIDQYEILADESEFPEIPYEEGLVY